jgi:hypothetical protein
MRTLLVLLAFLSAAPATAQLTKDRLCQAISETPNVAVPPRDRAFFQDHCACFDGAVIADNPNQSVLDGHECVYIGGRRFRNLEERRKLFIKRQTQTAQCEREVRELVAKDSGQEIAADDRLWDRHLDAKVVDLCRDQRSAEKVWTQLKCELDVRLPATKEQGQEVAADELLFDDTLDEKTVTLCRDHGSATKVLAELVRAKKAAERRRLLDIQERLPTIRGKVVTACKAFQACMHGAGNCWSRGGPGEAYDAACKELRAATGEQPILCQEKIDTTCSW